MKHRFRQAWVAALLTGTAAGLLAGCGGDQRPAGTTAGRSATTKSSSATPSGGQAIPLVDGGPAPLLILFKRVVGIDPLSSQLVVDSSGAATATITLGGPAGQQKHIFNLTREQLRRLRQLVAHTRLRDTTCCANPGYYNYWVTTEGHSWHLTQLGLPRSMRPLIHYMNAIMATRTGFG